MIKYCPSCKGVLTETEATDVFECKDCMSAFEIILAEEDDDEDDDLDEDDDFEDEEDEDDDFEDEEEEEETEDK